MVYELYDETKFLVVICIQMSLLKIKYFFKITILSEIVLKFRSSQHLY